MLSDEEKKRRQLESCRIWRSKNRAKIAASKKRWKEQNREEWRRRRRHQKIKDRISIEAYTALLASQDGKCAICLSAESNNKNSDRLCIDHCHKTGLVRGLLCHRCNTMLGAAKDDPAILRAAIEYLKRAR